MNQKKYRVGIVGAGFGLNVHLPAFQSLDNCEVIGLVASSFEKTTELSKKNGLAHVFHSWEEMIEKGNLDIIAIATPPATQIRIIEAALTKGISVFAEKPLGLKTEDADIVKHKQRVRLTPFAYDVEFMELPNWQLTKKLLVDGHVGRIQRVSVNWKMMTYANEHQISNWKTTTEQGGGALSAFGSHVFYYLEEFLGPIQKMNAMIDKDSNDNRDTDTHVQVNCQFVSGAIGHITIQTNQRGGSKHAIEFFGDRGQVLLENLTPDYMRGFQLQVCTSETQNQYSSYPEAREIPSQHKDGRVFAVQSLISRWLSQPMDFKPGYIEACRNQKLINLAIKSHQTAQWVNTLET